MNILNNLLLIRIQTLQIAMELLSSTLIGIFLSLFRMSMPVSLLCTLIKRKIIVLDKFMFLHI